jgi:hypothetical protein
MTMYKTIAGLVACVVLSFVIVEGANAATIVKPPIGPHCIKGVDCCVPGRPCWIK